tara:strand:- start:705 stop:878 length:174 start_codon:yes stop_codon:yes gene_type:complete
MGQEQLLTSDQLDVIATMAINLAEENREAKEDIMFIFYLYVANTARAELIRRGWLLK